MTRKNATFAAGLVLIAVLVTAFTAPAQLNPEQDAKPIFEVSFEVSGQSAEPNGKVTVSLAFATDNAAQLRIDVSQPAPFDARALAQALAAAFAEADSVAAVQMQALDLEDEQAFGFRLSFDEDVDADPVIAAVVTALGKLFGLEP